MHQVYLVIGSTDPDSTMDLFGDDSNLEFHPQEVSDLLSDLGYTTLEEALLDNAITKQGNEYGRMLNDNAFWDWWELGGRWSRILVNSEGELCDSCEKVDSLNTLLLIDYTYSRYTGELTHRDTHRRMEIEKDYAKDPLKERVKHSFRSVLGMGVEVIDHNQPPYEVSGFFTMWNLLETSENVHIVDCHS